MKIIILLSAALLSGCATLDDCCYEPYPEPNPDNSVRIWGHASGDDWSLKL
jgi:hypothetical protein